MRQLLCSVLPLTVTSIASAASGRNCPQAYATELKRAVDLLNRYPWPNRIAGLSKTNSSTFSKPTPLCSAYGEWVAARIIRGPITRNGSCGLLPTTAALIAKSLQLDPQFAEAFILCGHLYRLMGRPAEAYAALRRENRLVPAILGCKKWAGLLHDNGKYDDAALNAVKVYR